MLLESVCHFIGSLLICKNEKALKMMLVVMLSQLVLLTVFLWLWYDMQRVAKPKIEKLFVIIEHGGAG
jgi:hypothetical protein